MNHRSLLVISLLAFASCQSSRSYQPPRVTGTDLFTVKFHGRLSTTPEPLQPVAVDESVAAEECRDAELASASGLVQLDVRTLSVPRAWVDHMFAYKVPPRQRPGPVSTARSHNAEVLRPPAQQPRPQGTRTGPAALSSIPILAFMFDGENTAMPLRWWGPRGMTVPAEEAIPLFDELKKQSQKHQLQNRPYAHEMSFKCQPDVDAHVAVTRHMAFVESFRCSDNRNELTWEPMVSTAEIGMALEVRPTIAGDEVTLDFRLQLRDVIDVPTANSHIASDYGNAYGKRDDGLAVTLQAPLFSDHVFVGERACKFGEAFLVFGTNTTAKDEVLLTLIEVKKPAPEQSGS